MKTAKTTVHLFTQGRSICFKRLSAYEFVAFGEFTGQVGSAMCFDSITVRSPGGKEYTYTTSYFERPLAVCLKCPGQKDAWFGLASRDDVVQANADRLLAEVE